MKSKLFASILVTGLLAGCGGGGGGSTPVAVTTTGTAEGVYSGTSTGGTSPAFTMLVLENGDYWTLYGTRSGSNLSVAGIIQGTGTSNNGSFTSSNAKDFGSVPAISATASATYNATAQTITGTFTAPTATISFSGGPVAGSLFNYATPATLSSLSGVWTTTSTSGETITVTVASVGTFTALGTSGCRFTGTATPRASGKNVFNTSMTFGPAPCGLPNQTASGIAVVYPLTSSQTQVIFAQVDSARAYGSAAFGTR